MLPAATVGVLLAGGDRNHRQPRTQIPLGCALGVRITPTLLAVRVVFSTRTRHGISFPWLCRHAPLWLGGLLETSCYIPYAVSPAVSILARASSLSIRA